MCASEGKDFPKEEIARVWTRRDRGGVMGAAGGSLEARWLEPVGVRLPRAIQTGKLAETSRPRKGSGGSEQRRGRIRLLFKTTPVAVSRTGLELMLRDWGDLQDVRMCGGGAGVGGAGCKAAVEAVMTSSRVTCTFSNAG